MGKHSTLDTPAGWVTTTVGVLVGIQVVIGGALAWNATRGPDAAEDSEKATSSSSAPQSSLGWAAREDDPLETPAATDTPTATASASAGAGSAAPEATKSPVQQAEKMLARHAEAVAKLVEAEPVVPPAQFRVTSFNILGHSHATGNQRGGRFASGPVRAGYVADLLARHDIDVAGLQELQAPQWSVLANRLVGWEAYGPSLGREVMANSIAWRADTWSLVDAQTISIPYFGGNMREMPYVLLQHRESGRQVWFANFHNPADAHGPAQRWRDQAREIQVGLANSLGADGTPVVFTGDFNDREDYFCPLTAATTMKSASGGSTGPACAPPAQMDVDWIFGSEPVDFVDYLRVIDGLIDRTTDHPMIVAEAVVGAEG